MLSTKDIIKLRSKLSKLQRYYLKNLPQALKLRYLKTFAGLNRRRGILLYRFYQHNNSLDYRNSVKHKLNRFRDLSNDGHEPLYLTKSSKWIGVEIECYLPSYMFQNDEPEYITCGCCEGEGRVHLEDNHGNVYNPECGTCEGSGEVPNDDYDSSSDGGLNESVLDQFRDLNLGGLNIKTDGSLSSKGIEITIVFDSAKGYSKLEKLCNLLNQLGATIDTTCGLHIHVDHRDKDFDQVAVIGEKMERYLGLFRHMVAKSRLSSKYCQLQASTSDRYSAINLCSWSKFNTIEYRLHQGTTNFEKIKNWIRLLQACEVSTSPICSSIDSYLGHLRLEPDLEAYVLSRIKHFNENATDIAIGA